MDQDEDHRTRPTCPLKAGELSYGLKVKTEGGDTFISSLMGDRTVQRELQSKSLSMPTLVAIGGLGHVMGTATSKSGLGHGNSPPRSMLVTFLPGNKQQSRGARPHQVWPGNGKPEDLLNDNGVPQCAVTGALQMCHELVHVRLEVRRGRDLQRRSQYLRGTRGAHGSLARTGTVQLNNATMYVGPLHHRVL